MCNLYRMRRAIPEIAGLFSADAPAAAINTPEETLPGYPGAVVREEDGRRIVQQMTWGFPLRLRGMKPDSKPKPVNNIADLRKPMWLGLARKPQWRCLIPVTEFAEAEGPKGAKTRTWFSVVDQPVFAWAGLWRVSDEWGPVYSGVMTDCNDAIRPVHDRMPVILLPDDQERWLRGSFEDAAALQERCFPPALIAMERTSELWVRRRSPAEA